MSNPFELSGINKTYLALLPFFLSGTAKHASSSILKIQNDVKLSYFILSVFTSFSGYFFLTYKQSSVLIYKDVNKFILFIVEGAHYLKSLVVSDGLPRHHYLIFHL